MLLREPRRRAIDAARTAAALEPRTALRSRLAELRARAEQLLRKQEQTQAELDASHRELEQLQRQRGEDQATIARLEQQLTEERRRLDGVKGKIGELSAALMGA